MIARLRKLYTFSPGVHVLSIGPHQIKQPTILAPMAGVTDRPFRQLCRNLGAGLVVSEMVTSDTRLWNTRKSKLRLNHTGESEPRSVQIAGGDPEMMATAARMNADQGAQIIDINMGCPAKKVCKKAAGSALLKDEQLVQEILAAVVNAVDIPVTLKIRTGWSPEHRNGITIAKIAESEGIQALAVHGRTKACAYKGSVEYDTIAEIKSQLSIPVFANGDIQSPEDAKAVMNYTNADAVMIGRAAQGNPWIFQQINYFLEHNRKLPEPSNAEIKHLLIDHLNALYEFYGEFMGVRIARKHVGWYLQTQPNAKPFRKIFNQLESAETQTEQVLVFFDKLTNGKEIAA